MNAKKLLVKLLIASISFSACSKANVTVCILDAQNQRLECAHPDGRDETIELAKADNYICMSPDDAEKLLNYAQLKCGK